MKATFERNRAKVDTEVNDAMASMLTRPTPLQKSLTTFTNDQQELVNRVFKIQNSILDGKWEVRGCEKPNSEAENASIPFF